MEEVLRRENMQAAHRRVVQNGGAAGIDGMTVEEPGARFARPRAARAEVTSRAT